MKRSMGYAIVVLLLAFAVGCKKDKKEGEATDKAATDPATDKTATDPATDKTATDPATDKTATDPAAGGDALAPADLCKKIEEMATKEGGKALEMWNSKLKSDCEKELGEAKTENEAAYGEFSKCVTGKATMTEAMEGCKQIN
jgi:hypothetical protein